MGKRRQRPDLASPHHSGLCEELGSQLPDGPADPGRPETNCIQSIAHLYPCIPASPLSDRILQADLPGNHPDRLTETDYCIHFVDTGELRTCPANPLRR